jgi:hypothetical protein
MNELQNIPSRYVNRNILNTSEKIRFDRVNSGAVIEPHSSFFLKIDPLWLISQGKRIWNKYGNITPYPPE